MYGVGNARAIPAIREGAFQMQDEVERAIARELSRPTDNKLLRIAIEVLLFEGGRVQRIEKLRYFMQLELNGMGFSD